MPAPTRQPSTVLDPEALGLSAVYAQALLENTPDDAQAGELVQELDALVALLDTMPQSQTLLSGLALDANHRNIFVQRAFSGNVSGPIEALLGVMAAHGRLAILRETAHTLRRLLDQRMGKVEVTLTTALALDPGQQQEIELKLRETIGAPIVFKTRVDERILGGIVLRIGEQNYDASIAAELGRLKDSLHHRGASIRA